MVNEINRRKLYDNNGGKITVNQKKRLLNNSVLKSLINDKDFYQFLIDNKNKLKELKNSETEKLNNDEFDKIYNNNQDNLINNQSFIQLLRTKCFTSNNNNIKELFKDESFLKFIGENNLKQLYGKTYESSFLNKNDLIDVYIKFQDISLVDANINIDNLALSQTELDVISSFNKEIEIILGSGSSNNNLKKLLHDLDDYLIDILGNEDGEYDSIIDVYIFYIIIM